MAIALPTLRFTELDIDAIVAQSWALEDGKIDKAAGDKKEVAIYGAKKAMLSNVIDHMQVYKREELAYLDQIEKLHQVGKAEKGVEDMPGVGKMLDELAKRVAGMETLVADTLSGMEKCQKLMATMNI